MAKEQDQSPKYEIGTILINIVTSEVPNADEIVSEIQKVIKESRSGGAINFSKPEILNYLDGTSQCEKEVKILY